MIEKNRKISFGLGAGIVLAPLIFAWFTLRKGHSTLAKTLAFSWLILSLIICSASGSDSSNKLPEKIVKSSGTRIAITKTEETESAKPEQKTYSVGERFELGGFAYKILNVQAKTQIGGRFNREKAGDGAVFYFIEFEIENLQNETDTVLTGDFKIKDEKGREFKPSSRVTTALAMSGKQDLLLSQLQPGIKKKSTTAFELPLGATKSPVLVVPEKGFLSTGKVEVQLPGVSAKKSKSKKKNRSK